MFNVTRGATTPISLAEKKSYTGEDVVMSLREMFHDKCYICETKAPLSLNVEHFDAHMDNEDKKFDWNNLFFACARCNNFKRHLFNNLINCTDPKTDALRLIRHSLPALPYSIDVRIEAQNDDPRTVETAELIRKIFTEANTGNKAVTGQYLRERVFKRYAKLVKQMNKYSNQNSSSKKRKVALEKIQNLMSKEHEYSAFLRWKILDSPELLEHTASFID